MKSNTYMEEQLSRIDEAIRIAGQVREISAEGRDFFSTDRVDSTSDAEGFAEDTFKYFDTSYLQGQVEKLRLGLAELKKKLIEIKIENDQLLFEGGFLLCIDQVINRIFLSNTLCLLQAEEEQTETVMVDTIEKLEELRDLILETAQTDQKGTTAKDTGVPGRGGQKTAVHTEGAPAALGPYSQAVQTGRWIYVSGQIPIDPAAGEITAADIAGQTRQSLTNIRNILREAGVDMNHVVKTTVLLSDIADFQAMNEVYGEFFAEPYPARAAFQAAALPKGAKVEIEVVAMR